MSSSHTGELPIPELPAEARLCHLFPALGNMSLLSIGQLCDAGCQATFDATTASITYNNKVILTGTRSTATNKLWHLDHPLSTTQTEPVALAAVNQSASPESLVEFAQIGRAHV